MSGFQPLIFFSLLPRPVGLGYPHFGPLALQGNLSYWISCKIILAMFPIHRNTNIIARDLPKPPEWQCAHAEQSMASALDACFLIEDCSLPENTSSPQCRAD